MSEPGGPVESGDTSQASPAGRPGPGGRDGEPGPPGDAGKAFPDSRQEARPAEAEALAAGVPPSASSESKVESESRSGLATRAKTSPFGSALAAALEALREELVYPRARVRASLRRAGHHMRRFPRASAIVLALLSGGAVTAYSLAGTVRGLAAGSAFLATVGVLAALAPAALVWAWPAGVAAALGFCVWGAIELGPGCIWLGAAGGATLLAFYLASPAMVPLAGGAIMAHLAWPLGAAAAVVAFAAGVAALSLVGRRVTPPLVFAGWVVASSAIASRAALAVAGGELAATWTGRLLPGPWGLLPWTIAAALAAALLVWPHPRKG